MKILIVRFSSIGDIVLTTPVIRTLRNQLPQAEIHYLTKAAYTDLLAANPYLDQLHAWQPGDNAALLHTLRQARFDCVIDLHNSLRSHRLWLLLGMPKRHRFPKLNFQKWLYVNFQINRLPNIHIVDRYMKTVAPLGVTMDELGLDFFLDPSHEFDLEWLPEHYRQGFVVYAIGGQHATKRLPYLRMIELCDRIGKPTILLGGKEDAEVGEKVEAFFAQKTDPMYADGLQALGKRTQVLSLCGKVSVMQSASLIRRAKAVFTHDTGMMHIAAAFQKKIYSIWGNTTPQFGMYPYRTAFVVFENNKIRCRPCSKIGHDRCPKGHFKCMNDVVFDFWIP